MPEVSHDSKINDIAQRWVHRQLKSWHRTGIKRDQLEYDYSRLNRLFRFCIIDVHDNGTTTVRKKGPLPAGQIPESAAKMLSLRLSLYHQLIDDAVREHAVRLNTSIGLDLMDLVPDRHHLPMFCFQKLKTSHNILLPDIDIISNNWYLDQIEEASFYDKFDSAIFVGSSTGWSMSFSPFTRLDIEHNLSPRLHLANVLDGHPTIQFKIAHAAQCLDDAARERLRLKTYFSDFIPFEIQLRHKFLLSIDGNGATCSRVALALKSNSVLMKFYSPYQLLYFDELIPGRHLIGINSISDAEAVINREARSPGSFSHIPPQANDFFRDHINRDVALLYIAKLLEAFARLMRQ